MPRSGGGSVMPTGGGSPRCGFDILLSELSEKEGRLPVGAGGEYFEGGEYIELAEAKEE